MNVQFLILNEWVAQRMRLGYVNSRIMISGTIYLTDCCVRSTGTVRLIGVGGGGGREACVHMLKEKPRLLPLVCRKPGSRGNTPLSLPLVTEPFVYRVHKFRENNELCRKN